MPQNSNERIGQHGYVHYMSANEQSVEASLEERVRVLSAGLGLDPAFEVPGEVRRLVDAGETIKAVRSFDGARQAD